MLRNYAVDFVEICNIYVRKVIIKATKRIFNSDKICRSYSALNFGVTFLGHSVYLGFKVSNGHLIQRDATHPSLIKVLQQSLTANNNIMHSFLQKTQHCRRAPVCDGSVNNLCSGRLASIYYIPIQDAQLTNNHTSGHPTYSLVLCCSLQSACFSRIKLN